MKVELKNINKIRNASIELNSLTVIAGANDSGKSTVGKVLFSTIKALISGLSDSDEQKKEVINERTTSLIRRLNTLRMDKETDEKRRELFNFEFRHQLQQKNISDLNQIIKEREEWLNSLDIAPRQKMLALKDLNAIKTLLTESANYSTRVKAEFQSYIESEFLNNICSVKTDYSSIKYDSDKSFVNIKLSANEVTDIIYEMNSESVLDDITYVESPLYIHLLDALLRTTTYREVEKERLTPSLMFSPMVATHIKDIATKLDYSSKYLRTKGQRNDIFNIKSITGGSFAYDSNSRSLVWKKNNRSFSPINVASGIKSFGMIQLLLEADMINENKMLIWDEPENHLHPKWQVEFAHLLVNLAKAGIPVVVSSHSPYFIQGIRYFSRKEQIDKYVNYYLAEETEDGLANINEVTNDLNRVFTKLAEPLNEIMNLE